MAGMDMSPERVRALPLASWHASQLAATSGRGGGGHGREPGEGAGRAVCAGWLNGACERWANGWPGRVGGMVAGVGASPERVRALSLASWHASQSSRGTGVVSPCGQPAGGRRGRSFEGRAPEPRRGGAPHACRPRSRLPPPLPQMNAQFEALGMKPEEFISKVRVSALGWSTPV